MMNDYHDMYVKCHFLLLTDVFEKFRNNSLKKHGFSLSRYLSTPGLSREEMINFIKLSLNLFQMQTFFERVPNIFST